MRPSPRLAPPSWLRLPARTARLRLTTLYGALFLASGAGLLAITYLLVSRTTDDEIYSLGNHTASGRIFRRAPTTAVPSHVPSPIAQVRALHDSDLHHLLIWSGIALAIMTVVSIALGYYIAGRVLKPLRTITSTARTISARNLGERLALAGPEDEFKALGDTLDDLLTRLQTAFDAQQHFVANASHELRTPIAWQQAQLQVALADSTPTIDSLLATCAQLFTDSKQQQGLIEALLTLATSERGLDHHQPIDLSTLADTVLLGCRPDAEQQEIEITATIEPAPTTGHPALAERLIANLIDNAIGYNARGGHVHIQTGTTADGHARLVVSNTGPAIPASEIERLFEPFQRLKTTRTNGQSGYGLGLSIVQAIATAHHAAIATKSQPQGGLAVEIDFPLDRGSHADQCLTRDQPPRRTSRRQVPEPHRR